MVLRRPTKTHNMELHVVDRLLQVNAGLKRPADLLCLVASSRRRCSWHLPSFLTPCFLRFVVSDPLDILNHSQIKTLLKGWESTPLWMKHRGMSPAAFVWGGMTSPPPGLTNEAAFGLTRDVSISVFSIGPSIRKRSMSPPFITRQVPPECRRIYRRRLVLTGVRWSETWLTSWTVFLICPGFFCFFQFRSEVKSALLCF